MHCARLLRRAPPSNQNQKWGVFCQRASRARHPDGVGARACVHTRIDLNGNESAPQSCRSRMAPFGVILSLVILICIYKETVTPCGKKLYYRLQRQHQTVEHFVRNWKIKRMLTVLVLFVTIRCLTWFSSCSCCPIILERFRIFSHRL